MPKLKIVVFEREEPWIQFLSEAFRDTSAICQVVRTPEEALPVFRQARPEVIFTNANLLTKPLLACLQALRATSSLFRVFRLGPNPESSSLFPFDNGFEKIPPTLYDFHKRLVEHLPLPPSIRLLVVDDNPEIGNAFRDYFSHRSEPSFAVETAGNGIEAENRIRESRPDVLVLDLKMPEKDGRTLYQDLSRQGIQIPTIVFFDLVSVDEVTELSRWGNPSFVEKGSTASSLPAMAALIKKLVYFS